MYVSIMLLISRQIIRYSEQCDFRFRRTQIVRFLPHASTKLLKLLVCISGILIAEYRVVHHCGPGGRNKKFCCYSSLYS